MIAPYCEMKPSREDSKTLIFFQDAMCPCTKECFPISSLSHSRATVSFLSFEVIRREKNDAFVVSPSPILLETFPS